MFLKCQNLEAFACESFQKREMCVEIQLRVPYFGSKDLWKGRKSSNKVHMKLACVLAMPLVYSFAQFD
jgi:hypothetical protein